MPKFTGTQSRVFKVKASPEKAQEVMGDPEQFRPFLPDVETLEQVGDDTWRYTLYEKNEKGVRFKGEYTVQYTREDGELTWTTTSHGNMASEGRATFRAAGGGTEINYTETITTDMKVNRLLAKIIKPIVDREIAKGVGGYLDRVQDHLDSV